MQVAEGAAAEAGLRRGDTVVGVGDRDVGNRLDVERAVWDCKAGQKVEVTVLRDGKELALTLTLEKAEAERTVTKLAEPAQSAPAPAPAATGTAGFGPPRKPKK